MIEKVKAEKLGVGLVLQEDNQINQKHRIFELQILRKNHRLNKINKIINYVNNNFVNLIQYKF